jgi:hypothetical protein
MITLKCECCGFEKEFTSNQQAFESGWDDKDHFSIVCCDLCPASYLVLGVDHSEIHRQWERNGRPEKFGPDCVVPTDKAAVKRMMEAHDE